MTETLERYTELALKETPLSLVQSTQVSGKRTHLKRSAIFSKRSSQDMTQIHQMYRAVGTASVLITLQEVNQDISTKRTGIRKLQLRYVHKGANRMSEQ